MLLISPSQLVPAAPDSSGCSTGTDSGGCSVTSSISPGPAVLVPIRADSGGVSEFSEGTCGCGFSLFFFLFFLPFLVGSHSVHASGDSRASRA